MKRFPAEFENLPCGDHRMNAIFEDLFEPEDILIKKENGALSYWVRVQKDDSLTASKMEEIDEEEYEAIAALNDVIIILILFVSVGEFLTKKTVSVLF